MELTKDEVDCLLSALYFKENEQGWDDNEKALADKLSEYLNSI